jgi:hypothetical protein
MYLLSIVEGYLRRSGMRPTRFSREAVGDPNFVRELRRGREPGDEIAARVFAFIDRRDALPQVRKEAASCTR